MRQRKNTFRISTDQNTISVNGNDYKFDDTKLCSSECIFSVFNKTIERIPGACFNAPCNPTKRIDKRNGIFK